MAGLVGVWDARKHAMSWWLLWLGCALVVAGFVIDRMWNNLPFSGAALLGGLALAVALLALALKCAAKSRLATASGVVWLMALVHFAGLTSVASAGLLTLAALALGSLFVPSGWPSRAALSVIAGLALIGGVIGWLLPFPIHGRAIYLVALLVPVFFRWRVIVELWQSISEAWRDAVADAPRAMWLAVMAAGIVTTCAWLPTIHYDDLAYHVGLPSQLLSLGYYKMDVASNLWAVSAWAGDVLQAVAWLVAGHQARGAMDVLWLILGLALMWRLCEALDMPPWLRCAAVALYASLPLTAGALTGMQTEGPTAAVTAGIALLVVQSPKADRRRLLAFALLFGLLLGLKISNLMVAGPLGLWLLCRWRGQLPWRSLPTALLLLMLVAGSSFTYGWVVAGNPVLPVFNAVFHSPYYSWANFHDNHWNAGFHWDIVWNLVFHTSRYMEGGDGTAGFVLIALGGCLVAALFDRRARPLALVGMTAFLLPLTQVQYLRYAHQALVLLIPAMLCGMSLCLSSTRRRRWLVGVLGLLVLGNLAYVSAGDWQLRHGVLQQFLTGSRQDFMEKFAPIDKLVDVVDRRYGRNARVLITSDAVPYAAGFAGRAFVVSWYDQELADQAARADRDATGAAWVKLVDETGANLLVLQSGHVSPALAAALNAMSHHLVLQSGDLQLWRVDRASHGEVLPGAAGQLSVGFDVAKLPDGPMLASARLRIGCAPQGAQIALSWTATTESGEPWSRAEWVRCLPDDTARAELELDIPTAIAGFKVAARPVESPLQKLTLVSSELIARNDLDSKRDLARKMRTNARLALARWIDPRTSRSVQYPGVLLPSPKQGVVVRFDTAKAPHGAAFVDANLEMRCGYSATPIVVGWKVTAKDGSSSAKYAWSFCGRNGVAHARYSAKVTNRVASITATAVPSDGVDMGLRLLGSSASYVGNNGILGIVNRKRIKLARWLRPVDEVVRVEP